MDSNDADIPPEGGMLGDELSEGSANLADTIETRPQLPQAEGLKLGNAVDVDDLAYRADREEYLFGAIELFKTLSTDEIREVVAATTSTNLRAGQRLFSQGDEAKALYILETGELQVRASTVAGGEEVVLAVLGSGTVVGEMSLLDGGPRSATVEALGDCVVYQLSRESFQTMRQERSPAAYKVILRLAKMLGDRRRQTDRRIEEVFRDPAKHIEVFESQVHEMLARIHKA